MIDNLVVGETRAACPSSVQKLAFVETIDCSVTPPDAHFTFDLDGACTAVPIQFNDASSGVDPATSWLWDFGDGAFSTDEDPMHQYDLPGIFEITMIAYNDGGSDTARVIVNLINCSVVLPIDLLYYTGKDMRDYNLLDWSTASESNSGKYDLYRLNEHGEERIATLDAAFNSSQQTMYSWKDYEAPPLVNYYRLDQTDMDGTLSFSETLVIDNSTSWESSAILISPNPATDRVRIQLGRGDWERLEIFDGLGHVVHSENVQDQQSLEISVSDWTSGIYSVVVHSRNQIESNRMIVR